MAVSVAALLYWKQFLALFGAGPEPADWTVRRKKPGISWKYVLGITSAIAVFAVLPYRRVVAMFSRGEAAREDCGMNSGSGVAGGLRQPIPSAYALCYLLGCLRHSRYGMARVMAMRAFLEAIGVLRLRMRIYPHSSLRMTVCEDPMFGLHQRVGEFGGAH